MEFANQIPNLSQLDGKKELFFSSIFRHTTETILEPAKILSSFLCTAPLQYIPKILFIQATIGCVTTNETKNALYNETAI